MVPAFLKWQREFHHGSTISDELGTESAPRPLIDNPFVQPTLDSLTTYYGDRLPRMLTGPQLAAQENETLAPYAMRSADSRGRDYPVNPDLWRTEFQRDRDRIIHSTAFRKLEYKTQVYMVHYGDYFRTRIT